MAKRGRPKKSKNYFKELLQDIIPIDEMFSKDEKKVFQSLVDTYLKDFDESQLSANDMDDIICLASNKIFEFRLLKTTKNDPDKIIDVSQAMDKLKKQTEKLKENLAARRKDRIDPKKFSGYSIIDLAAAWDENKKKELLKVSSKFIKEDEKLSKSDLLIGNRLDQDAKIIKKVENN